MAGDITPNVRDGSVGPPKTYVGESTTGTRIVIPDTRSAASQASENISNSSIIPPGYKYVGRTADGGVIVEKIVGIAPTLAESISRQYNQQAIDARQEKQDRIYLEQLSQPRKTAWAQRIVDEVAKNGTSMNGVYQDLDEDPSTRLGQNNAAIEGVLSNMGDMGAAAESALPFIMSYGSVVDPLTLARTGVQQSRGNFMSADSMERAMKAGQLDPGTLEGGKNTNYMSLGAGLAWLRKLSVKDRAAYNRLVVMLRNANYGQLPDEDSALPLDGYSRRVAEAFLEAAGDLAQANDAGDDRDLMTFLQDRGKGYEEFLKQQQEEEFEPVEREYQDPATIAAAARAEAKQVLGRALSDAEEKALLGHFRGLEDAYFDDLDGARKEDLTFAGYRPDTTGQVDDYLQGDEFEQERQAYNIGQYANEFMRMMGVST